MAAMISAPATATVASEPSVVVAEAVPVQEMDRDGTAATPVVFTTPAATDEEIEAFFKNHRGGVGLGVECCGCKSDVHAKMRQMQSKTNFALGLGDNPSGSVLFGTWVTDTEMNRRRATARLRCKTEIA